MVSPPPRPRLFSTNSPCLVAIFGTSYSMATLVPFAGGPLGRPRLAAAGGGSLSGTGEQNRIPPPPSYFAAKNKSVWRMPGNGCHPPGFQKWVGVGLCAVGQLSWARGRLVRPHHLPTFHTPPSRLLPSTGQRALHHRGNVLEALVLLNPSDKSICDEVSSRPKFSWGRAQGLRTQSPRLFVALPVSAESVRVGRGRRPVQFRGALWLPKAGRGLREDHRHGLPGAQALPGNSPRHKAGIPHHCGPSAYSRHAHPHPHPPTSADVQESLTSPDHATGLVN